MVIFEVLYILVLVAVALLVDVLQPPPPFSGMSISRLDMPLPCMPSMLAFKLVEFHLPVCYISVLCRCHLGWLHQRGTRRSNGFDKSGGEIGCCRRRQAASSSRSNGGSNMRQQRLSGQQQAVAAHAASQALVQLGPGWRHQLTTVKPTVGSESSYSNNNRHLLVLPLLLSLALQANARRGQPSGTPYCSAKTAMK